MKHWVTVCFVVLNLVDAILTLFLLGHGADEINPLMAMAHGISPVLFMVLKLGIIYASLGILIVLPVSAAVRRRVIGSGVSLYLAVVLYECMLLAELVHLTP